MMRAYSEKYLDNAATVFSEMVDYVVNDRNISGDQFMHMFITSGAAKQFERGNPRYIVGRSGIEIADEVLSKTAPDFCSVTPDIREVRTPEYWAGWSLAQYQWYTAKPFGNIMRHLPFSGIVKLYSALHEADITKFNEVADSIITQQSPPTNLKRIRTAAKMTQKKLATESGVTLRSIQMYEQRNKDINKAQAINLAKMARVLGCDIEDLLEIFTKTY